MNYNLNTENKETHSVFKSGKSLLEYTRGEKKALIIAFVAMIVTALLSLVGPIVIGNTVDNYFMAGKFKNVLINGGLLLLVYLVTVVASSLQTRMTGAVGQRILFKLRNKVFDKLQDLPYDFFNQNKAGDLISRINNDTEKINEFFSHSLMHFMRTILIMIGAGIFIIALQWKLGLAALMPAVLILIFTKAFSPWLRKKNAKSLKTLGILSSEIQESLNNFKVVVAFGRRDYFRKRFAEVNQDNYKASMTAGIANNLFMPIYTLLSNIGLLIVLFLGIYFISIGEFSLGLLISFIAYVNNFYNPLRQLAQLWSNLQIAMAAWGRIKNILELENDMPQIGKGEVDETATLVSFRDVSFAYPKGSDVLRNVTFNLRKGKTYAFVGPTGGGKSTTASLISRLYDATKGKVLLDGVDIRSFSDEERTNRISVILQDPFLFSGTVRENILYGNDDYENVISDEELADLFDELGLNSLLEHFSEGLNTEVDVSGIGISLGQKQLIAFMRAVLRKPELLILDEATANIDTVTEKLLDEILQGLPKSTTKVIIAHRLNTIANADVIYFINSKKVIRAGSLDEAVEMLMGGNMAS